MDFKTRLRELRKEKRFTQSELAEMIATTQKTISDYECGVSNPDLGTVNRLSEIFDVSIDYMLGNTDARVTAYVASMDGTITPVQHQLLDATKGLTVDDLNEILKYADYLKSKKGKK